MLQSEFLYHQNQFLIIAILFVLMLLAAELGFRRGRALSGKLGDATRTEITTLQAALIGLLALLLAFTFDMAVTRYGLRLQLVVDESNAIGTMVLRAETLPDEMKGDVLAAARDYVTDRVELFDNQRTEADKAAAAEAVSRLQTQMWTVAVSAARQNDRSAPFGLFESSLNEVFDIGARRNAAMHNHVPETVLALLFIASIFAIGSTGYASGLGGNRNSWAVVTMSVVIALVILVIIDLDRPGRGFIRVSQQRLVNLVETLPPPPAEPHVQSSARLADPLKAPGS